MSVGRFRITKESAIGVGLIVIATVHGTLLRWLSDDAFISFRYAKNWVDGNGLVFNVGERVEGYTNPLWTLFIALGLRVGVRAETWSIVWGIAAYAASIALLVRIHRRFQTALSDASSNASGTVPIAALLGAMNPEWATYATSGLETSAFTFFAVAGFDALLRRRAPMAGALFALATITRHDGMIFAVIAVASFAAQRSDRVRSVLRCGLVFAAIWLPFTWLRIRYYGDFFPNTYYAKSANVPWYGQGFIYLKLFATKYWSLPLGIGFVVWAIRRASPFRTLTGALALSASFAVAYTAYVVRVGGDFMFGRVLVPTIPFFLVLADAAWLWLTRTASPTISWGGASLVAIAQFATPTPLTKGTTTAGIVDERTYYDPEMTRRLDEQAATVASFVDGLPLRVAIYGGQARLAYLAPIEVAIEAHAGLTDRVVAHQPLAKRGRIGHEKHASFPYLVLERKAHLTFSTIPERFGLDDYVPQVFVYFDNVRARLLHWDPKTNEALRARGARVDDFVPAIDTLIAALPTTSDEDVRANLAKLDHFYFMHVNDPARRAPFVARLTR